MRMFIIVRTSFEALHQWKDCPIKEVDFLKYPHRHIFHVEAKFQVTHNDRDKEFIVAKRRLTEFVRDTFEGKSLGSTSCEMMCEAIYKEFKLFGLKSVKVFEDDENGAELIV